MNTYNFSIQNDIPNHKVNSDKLREQILAAAITVALDRIDTDDSQDLCSVVFKDDLSQDEADVLAALMAAHDGTPIVQAQLQPVRVQNYTKPGRKLCVVGRRKVFEPGESNDLDMLFTEEREIQGVKVQVEHFTSGDWMELKAEAPLGPGGAMVTLVQWTDTIFVPPSGELVFESEDSQTMPAGITLCLEYHSVAEANSLPKPCVYVYLKTWK